MENLGSENKKGQNRRHIRCERKCWNCGGREIVAEEVVKTIPVAEKWREKLNLEGERIIF